MIERQTNISLRDYNTFGIDVRCDRFVTFTEAGDLKRIFGGIIDPGQSWNFLSGGSNIIFTGDFRGTILHPVGGRIEIISEDNLEVRVSVDAAVEWDRFVEWSVERSLWGAENLSYIPGLVGASPIQNIGAYGAEVKDIIETVEMFDTLTGKFVKLAGQHCAFGYRDSVFKHELRGRVIITSVIFRLSRRPKPVLRYGDLGREVEALGGPTPSNIRKAVTEIRKRKLPEPEELGNAGSFFKNPVVPDDVATRLKESYPQMPVYVSGIDGYTKLAAGWLIDMCGWKGRSMGRVGVHESQALVLVNHGGASGEEVMALAGRIQSEVAGKFGIEIETEVNVL